MSLANVILPALALIVVGVLFTPALRSSELWRAIVSPLASIVGSGFLVSGPLLAHAVGPWAPIAMFAIVAFAYAIGSVIRFNILYAEPNINDRRGSFALISIQRLSDLALGLAYIVSVAFYLRLLSSFVLSFGGTSEALVQKAFTSAVLIFIALIGWLRGLHGLEKLEETAVAIKLAIIVALLCGLVGFDWQWLREGGQLAQVALENNIFDSLRIMAGLLLVVQGFEISRYLGSDYDAALRVRSMRLAQIIAGIIYLLFIGLGLPLLLEASGPVNETAIIGIAASVAVILPSLLVLAAVMSQFSAAVADTVGAGGVFSELSGFSISSRKFYLLLIVAAIVLVWTVNVFEIITLASRAFALYYFLQCLVAIKVCCNAQAGHSRFRLVAYSLIAAVLVAVIVFAVPVD
ncbi:MAG: hypothetical protein R3332_04755 [Pseudohongiellaceae bacterium]|nr:hypothetical protein [Pseudohongiellaceae bacterium]